MNIKKINWKRLFLNKYFIVTIIFAVFMIFFDKYNLLKLHKMNNELDEMQERVDDYNEEYEKDSIKTLMCHFNFTKRHLSVWILSAEKQTPPNLKMKG